mmetsp:Transcript_15779/g.24218  ORF Transcript_15779/g.24218 Transcript_15779/m.24218 type:complete len:314 (-) Transcript_15779:35-976(-)
MRPFALVIIITQKQSCIGSTLFCIDWLRRSSSTSIRFCCFFCWFIITSCISLCTRFCCLIIRSRSRRRLFALFFSARFIILCCCRRRIVRIGICRSSIRIRSGVIGCWCCLFLIRLRHLLKIQVFIDEHRHIAIIATQSCARQSNTIRVIVIALFERLKLLRIILQLREVIRANLRQNVGQQFLDFFMVVMARHNERIRRHFRVHFRRLEMNHGTIRFEQIHLLNARNRVARQFFQICLQSFLKLIRRFLLSEFLASHRILTATRNRRSRFIAIFRTKFCLHFSCCWLWHCSCPSSLSCVSIKHGCKSRTIVA